MIQDFIPEIVKSGSDKKPSYFFIFKGDHLLVLNGETGRHSIPLINYREIESAVKQVVYLGRCKDVSCYTAILSDECCLTEDKSFYRLRLLYGKMDDNLFHLAGYAYQINCWNHNYRYCGRCGRPTTSMEEERAKICSNCQLTFYPRISPAVIVAIVRENQLLLARANHFPKKLWSVIAGFVEPGESLEECVKREVKEEVNIEVQNIRYFGSQSWPFTNSMMIGFVADYHSGEIEVDKHELAEAGWFTADHLPTYPDRLSIASQLVEWFKDNFPHV